MSVGFDVTLLKIFVATISQGALETEKAISEEIAFCKIRPA